MITKILHSTMRILAVIITLASTSLIVCPVLAQGQVAYEILWNSILSLDELEQIYVSVSDLNGDGLTDLLMGGDNSTTIEKTPLSLLINNGDGTFREATLDYIIGDLRAASPKGSTADFNGDGRLDVAIFDAGNMELGQDPIETGFYGEEPILLLSDENGKLVISSALADAERAADPDKEGKLHIKLASTGDIDNDGDIDIFVESGGGFNRIAHFLVNNGDGTFIADPMPNDRIDDALRAGPNGGWRNIGHLLHDMNNDGFLDLVLGTARNIDSDQDDAFARVAYNDGAGRFTIGNSTALPLANWNDGWTGALSIISLDLNEDELPDLVLYQTRSGNVDRPDDGYTGLYLQFLINNGDETFHDATDDHIGDQSAATVVLTDLYGLNIQRAKLKAVDMNSDGYLDLVTAGQQIPVGLHAPLIFLNNGSNYFTPIDPDMITAGQIWFAENAYPIHLNDDGLVDLVHTDLRPGPDGVYGGGDETTDIISMIAIQGGPTHAESHNQIPDDFGLSQNYPNPFKPVTTIAFDLPKPSHVTLRVYNLMGQKVATLVSVDQPAGHYAMTWNATGFASGVYVYRLQAGDYSETRKLLLLK